MGSTYALTRWLYLRLLGFIHFSAFASYAVLIVGLNGEHGILPTRDLLKAAGEQLGLERFLLYPTIAWLDCSDATLLAIAWGGACLSLLLILGVATGPVLAILSLLWLSIVTGGGEFTGFQSDGMLVEASVASLFLAPWNLFEPPLPVPKRFLLQSPPSALALWLIRFLVFRIMFASGIVKILSGDPSWADFTALQYHFETQPIPTPLAWWAHHLPPILLKAGVAGTFVSELFAPLLIFAPRKARMVGALLMMLLHVSICLTGNYTFLNMLLIVMCLTLLDDQLLERFFPARLRRSIEGCIFKAPAPKALHLISNTLAGILLILSASASLASIIGRSSLPQPLSWALSYAIPLRIANSYGLFAVMTKTRPEIVFEGSNDGKTWYSYEFLYKPGDDLKRPPPWVEPHMPRLDWRLWFAAMEPIDTNPWVLSFVKRLLEGTPEMKQFFAKDPFPDKPPLYMRAFVYNYHFTDATTRNATGCWWRRENQSIYLPAVTLKSGKLVLVDL